MILFAHLQASYIIIIEKLNGAFGAFRSSSHSNIRNPSIVVLIAIAQNFENFSLNNHQPMIHMVALVNGRHN